MCDEKRGPPVAPGTPRLPVGGPMSAQWATFLEDKRKKFKSLVDLPSPSQYLSYLLCFDNDHPRGLFGARNGQRAKFFNFGAPLSPGEGREGPNGVQNTSTHCAWVGRIHTRCLGPLTDLYGTPMLMRRQMHDVLRIEDKSHCHRALFTLFSCSLGTRAIALIWAPPPYLDKNIFVHTVL